jgi:predicted Rossmann fold nucleotide-binding protein DprA/Smf involved in DNA uptake
MSETTIYKTGAVWRDSKQLASIAPIPSLTHAQVEAAIFPPKPKAWEEPATPPVPPALPYAPQSATSKAAAKAHASPAQIQAEQVFTAIARTKGDGLTCDQIEEALGMSHQSASARITALVDDGRVVRTPRTRKTRSGHKASVLISAEFDDQLALF